MKSSSMSEVKLILQNFKALSLHEIVGFGAGGMREKLENET